MIGSLGSLTLAVVLFVATHLVLSHLPVRARLIAALGEAGFRASYAIVALVLLAWVIAAYQNAPMVSVWSPPLGLQHLALTLMAIACLFLVAGYSTRNPTILGADTATAIARGPTGMFRITRHPVMWAVALWGIAHLLANGDAAGMILFGGLTILALGGAAHSDARRQRILGASWSAYRDQTSFVPFGAIATRQTGFRFNEIGWVRLVGALVLFALLLASHSWLFGVSPLPGVI